MGLNQAVVHALAKIAECRMSRAKAQRAANLKAELVKQADAHPDMWKFAFAPPGVPFSSLTARSAYATGPKFQPKPETDRRGMLQRQLETLLGGMSRSRARIVDARRQARESVQRGTP